MNFDGVNLVNNVSLGLKKRVGMQQQRELTRNHRKNDKRTRKPGLVFAVAAFLLTFLYAQKSKKGLSYG
jgi:hypothetical protein